MPITKIAFGLDARKKHFPFLTFRFKILWSPPMKNTLYILLFLLLGLPILAVDLPPLQEGNYVLDNAGLFTSDELQKLNDESKDFESSTGVRFISVYLSSTEGEGTCEVATRLLNEIAKQSKPETMHFIFIYALEDNYACYRHSVILEPLITPVASDRIYHKAFFPEQAEGRYLNAFLAVQRELKSFVALEFKDFQDESFRNPLPFFNEELAKIHSDTTEILNEEDWKFVTWLTLSIYAILGLIFFFFRGAVSWVFFIVLAPFHFFLSFVAGERFGIQVFLIYFFGLFLMRILLSLGSVLKDVSAKVPSLPSIRKPTPNQPKLPSYTQTAQKTPSNSHNELKSNFYTEEENNERFG